MKIYVKTLGCEKNTVDSENALALLAQTGAEETQDPKRADVLMVNTCGFIHDAKQQSIETIFDLIRIKKKKQKLIVTGCLSQRYAKELADAGAAVMLREGEFDAASLYETALTLLKDPARLAKMSDAMAKCGVPDATNRITELIFDYVKE